MQDTDTKSHIHILCLGGGDEGLTGHFLSGSLYGVAWTKYYWVIYNIDQPCSKMEKEQQYTMAAPLFSFGENLINLNGLTSFVFISLFFCFTKQENLIWKMSSNHWKAFVYIGIPNKIKLVKTLLGMRKRCICKGKSTCYITKQGPII